MSDREEEADGADSAPTPGRLRADAVRAREELGGAAAESAAPAEGKVRARERVEAARQQIDDGTAQARDKAAWAVERLQERTPEHVRQQVRETVLAARRNRGQILAVVSGTVLIYLAVRRTRR